ncbi:MAG: pectate lyase [bacterium]|jgi:PelA/Pel-15E family pectate lyase|nr:pectate lyase [bacterium]
MKKRVLFFVPVIALLGLGFWVTEPTKAQAADWIAWKACLSQAEEWYGSDEAVRIAHQLILYQHDVGGWSKNIDMAEPLTQEQKGDLIQDKPDRTECTIDNGSTYRQLAYLARVYDKTKTNRFKAAFEQGLDFLLSIQYPNGGWPQFPYKKGYYTHITFNDDAMIGVMILLRDVANGEPPYTFVDAAQKEHARQAVEKGIDCILRCQIVVDGKKTGWCAQHDEHTLAPAPARTYEKISISGSEGVGILRFLMQLESPSSAVIAAVEAAVAWLESVQLEGIKEIRQPVPGDPKTLDKVIVAEPTAPPLWARFYEIGTNRPIFCGRDGVVKSTLAEIELERRTGYSWYTERPRDLLQREVPAWRARWGSGALDRN